MRMILANINKRILEQTMGPKTSMQETFERTTIDLVSIQGEKMKLYTEKIHIYANKKLTEALLVIYGSTLYITNTDGSFNSQFSQSLDIV